MSTWGGNVPVIDFSRFYPATLGIARLNQSVVSQSPVSLTFIGPEHCPTLA